MVSERGGMEGKVVLITGCTSGIGKAALAGMSGKYLMDRKEVSPAEPRDEALQKRLWEASEQLTNLKVPS